MDFHRSVQHHRKRKRRHRGRRFQFL